MKFCRNTEKRILEQLSEEEKNMLQKGTGKDLEVD